MSDHSAVGLQSEGGHRGPKIRLEALDREKQTPVHPKNGLFTPCMLLDGGVRLRRLDQDCAVHAMRQGFWKTSASDDEYSTVYGNGSPMGYRRASSEIRG
jgi:hypothetical protein